MVTAPPAPTVIAANLVTSVPAFTGTDSDKIAAYTRLNTVRGQCGFGLLAQNMQLETSAQNHSNYMGLNFAAHPDAYGHVETAAYLGFTGLNPQDRNAMVSYGNLTQGEDIAPANTTTSSTPQVDAVNTLLQAGYHLKSIVGQGAYDVGLGNAILTPGTNAITVELGSKIAQLQDISSTDISTYPCAGSTTKSSPFGIGHETPEPLPGRDYTAMPVGAPIYVRVRVGQTLAITSFTVVAANGTSVAQGALLTQATDPNKLLGSNEVLFYPNTQLTAGTQYTVTIVGANNGTAFTRTFVFSTL